MRYLHLLKREFQGYNAKSLTADLLSGITVAAVALPLHQEGFSRAKSFVFGALSGIVEPIFGIVVVLAAAQLTPFMPWLLSAAAGAMLYVVVEELIPEAHLNEHSHPGTLGVMVGFLVMMVLDVALG